LATTTMAQDELLRHCMDEVVAIDAEAQRLTGGLAEGQLQWNPPDGGWSIAQVFDHLATSNGSYFGPMRSAMERARAAGAGRPDRPWRSSFLGGVLIRSLRPSARRALPTPHSWRPGRAQRTDPLEAFLATQGTLAELLREAKEIDLVDTRLSSPVSRLIRLNLGDAFMILVVHDRRHLGQIARILARESFPAR
jgi:hypothetical protein